MPAFSTLKNSFMSALSSSYDAQKPRARRRVVSFNEALNNLKATQTGIVTCSAFHSLGKCRKEIVLEDLDFIASLDEIDLADVQTPIKLMPLMLCSTHWEKTVYYNALFLNWLSIYGSKHDSQHYENMVIDYQSAVTIDNNEHSISEISAFSKPIAHGEGRLALEPASPAKGQTNIYDLKTMDQSQDYTNQIERIPLEHSSDYGGKHSPEVLMLVNMESYASIEFGVAKLEIMYQENLKCIAMTSDGWRCQEIIHNARLQKAREMLSSSVNLEAELRSDILPPLVLCPGHALGQLPEIYSEKWAAFAEQRLTKEEAMSGFDADYWMSVFRDARSDAHALPINLNRPKSASGRFERQSEECDFTSNVHSPSNSLGRHIKTPSKLQKSRLAPPLPTSSNSEAKTISQDGKLPKSWDFNSNPLITLSTWNTNVSQATRIWDNPKTGSVRPESSTIVNTSVSASEPFAMRNNSEDNLIGSSNADSTNTSAVATEGSGDSKLSDRLLEQEAHNFSFTKGDVKKANPFDNQTDTQDSQPKQHDVPSTSMGTDQDSNKSLPQNIIESNLLKEICSPLPQGGYISILKSSKKKLVKIVEAGSVSYRKGKFEAGCQLQDLDTCLVESIYVEHPERVAKLAQLELQNFRAKINCRHTPSGCKSKVVEQEHREWFGVPCYVASGSVKLWSDFVNMFYSSGAIVADGGERMRSLLPQPSFEETFLLAIALRDGDNTSEYRYHELQHKRYREWLKNCQCSIKGLPRN
ncbi:hypothetical protein B0O99DRAFT_614165 [Bisporella sp. PMI_857]|nr:hypothetical protein B0O99DRAFT_614165 [Bisporella sp. PMI_857]